MKFEKLKIYLRLVKFEHTVFALPFALLGFFLGLWQESANLDIWLLILVVLCMVFARNAAMGFNRWLDRKIDKLNPRTSTREIPAGIVKPYQALLFVAINMLLFVIAAKLINDLCFYLSPVALFVILFYSYTKRITPLCHFVLSLGLAISPVGASIAVTGVFDLIPVLLGLVIFFWVSGFDIIYALQDEEFDKQHNLKSIPVLFGKKKALFYARIIHLISACLVILVAYLADVAWPMWAGSGIFIAMLIYQHLIVKHDDLSKVNLAFFTTNGIASIIYGTFAIVSLYL